MGRGGKNTRRASSGQARQQRNLRKKEDSKEEKEEWKGKSAGLSVEKQGMEEESIR